MTHVGKQEEGWGVSSERAAAWIRFCGHRAAPRPAPGLSEGQTPALSAFMVKTAVRPLGPAALSVDAVVGMEDEPWVQPLV